jgi:hypothetical protein
MAHHTFKVTLVVTVTEPSYEGSQLSHHKARRDAVEAVTTAMKLKANPSREDGGVVGFELTHVEQIN